MEIGEWDALLVDGVIDISSQGGKGGMRGGGGGTKGGYTGGEEREEGKERWRREEATFSSLDLCLILSLLTF